MDLYLIIDLDVMQSHPFTAQDVFRPICISCRYRDLTQKVTHSCFLFQLLSYVYLSQVMSLGNSLQLPPPVLVIPSVSDVMLLGTGMVSPSGESVAPVSVSCLIAQQMPHLHVDLAMPTQLYLGQSLEQTAPPSHQHWVALQPPNWMVHWLSVSVLVLLEMLGTWLETVHSKLKVRTRCTYLQCMPRTHLHDFWTNTCQLGGVVHAFGTVGRVMHVQVWKVWEHTHYVERAQECVRVFEPHRTWRYSGFSRRPCTLFVSLGAAALSHTHHFWRRLHGIEAAFMLCLFVPGS